MQIMTYTQKNQVNWVINQGLGVGVGSRESGFFWGKGVGSGGSGKFKPHPPTPKKMVGGKSPGEKKKKNLKKN